MKFGGSHVCSPAAANLRPTWVGPWLIPLLGHERLATPRLAKSGSKSGGRLFRAKTPAGPTIEPAGRSRYADTSPDASAGRGGSGVLSCTGARLLRHPSPPGDGIEWMRASRKQLARPASYRKSRVRFSPPSARNRGKTQMTECIERPRGQPALSIIKRPKLVWAAKDPKAALPTADLIRPRPGKTCNVIFCRTP